MKINEKEIYRYLGYKNTEPDKQILSIIDTVVKEVTEEISPKYAFISCNINIKEDFTLCLNQLEMQSKDLYNHLKSCDKAIIFGATLGVGADNIIRKYSKIDMSKAVIAQAVCAAAIEDYCDLSQKKIVEILGIANRFILPRFSPGYGDFNLDYQPKLLDMIKAQKNIGLMVTDSLMLVPTKSVTAVIGLSEKQFCGKGGCMMCGKTNCEFKKD